MSQTAAAIWSALPPHSSSPDSRNNYNNSSTMEARNPSAPFINPPFDLVDILNPARDKRMSLDYPNSAPPSAGAQSQHSYSQQQEFDHSMGGLHNGASNGHSNHMNGQGFDHPSDAMDMNAEQSGYEFFSPSNGANGFGSRYRTNASSSSSLGQGFNGLSSADGLYPHSASPFSDSMASFSATSQHSYDLVNGLPSSYSSGKVSPLTPSDPVMGLQNSPGFPSLPGANGVAKDYPSQYSDLLADRRHSNAGSFQSDFHDDFGNGALGLGGFPPPQSSLQHFQERLGRYEPNGHYPGTAPSAGSVPSQLHHRPSLDMIRGVNPHATHGGVGGYDDMGSPFPPMNPTTDLALRMPGQNIGVDETLSRMKLQAHVGMGAATDLQSFIR
jgi:hypothetical protein